jgi:hypothetical protein
MTMRRVTLLDAMILVAAIAGGLALIRGYVADVDRAYQGSAINRPYVAKERIVGSLVCVVTSLTLGTLALRARQPRPHRWLRQPGAVGLVVAAALLAYEAASVITILAYFACTGRGPIGYSFYFLSRWWETVGPATFAAWLAMWLTGVKRAVPDWVEYLGRGIGVAWIALLVGGRIASAIW